MQCRLNRYLQYGIKFWFGTSAVMALCLSLSADVPTIQVWRPLYLLLTVIIVCSQKVDTTLSKGVLRVAASILGGTYGILLQPQCCATPPPPPPPPPCSVCGHVCKSNPWVTHQ